MCIPMELLPAAAIAQQTVDGFAGALEIAPRSSYVPNAPLASDVPAIRRCAPFTRRCSKRPELQRLEMPIWMK
jgi:hypothetical protein